MSDQEQQTITLGPCVVELMGHRRFGAYVSEATIAGAGFLRLEVPSDPPATQFVRPESVYALTPTTEDVVKRMAQAYKVEPVSRFELLPAPAAEVGPREDPADDGVPWEG